MLEQQTSGEKLKLATLYFLLGQASGKGNDIGKARATKIRRNKRSGRKAAERGKRSFQDEEGRGMREGRRTNTEFLYVFQTPLLELEWEYRLLPAHTPSYFGQMFAPIGQAFFLQLPPATLLATGIYEIVLFSSTTFLLTIFGIPDGSLGTNVCSTTLRPVALPFNQISRSSIAIRSFPENIFYVPNVQSSYLLLHSISIYRTNLL